MNLQPKLCPLSFGFVMPGPKMPSLVPSQTTQQLNIGFPCLKEKCTWWHEGSADCVMQEMANKMELMLLSRREEP